MQCLRKNPLRAGHGILIIVLFSVNYTEFSRQKQEKFIFSQAGIRRECRTAPGKPSSFPLSFSRRLVSNALATAEGWSKVDPSAIALATEDQRPSVTPKFSKNMLLQAADALLHTFVGSQWPAAAPFCGRRGFFVHGSGTNLVRCSLYAPNRRGENQDREHRKIVVFSISGNLVSKVRTDACILTLALCQKLGLTLACVKS
jgi:hypothetical protein